MTDQPKIAPRIDEDGEPRCSREKCPARESCVDEPDYPERIMPNAVCIPALRRQRDEARAALVAEREMVKAACPGCDRVERAEAEVERLRAEILSILDRGHTAAYDLATDIRAAIAEKE